MRSAPLLTARRWKRAVFGLAVAVGVVVPATLVSSATSAGAATGPLLSYVVNTGTGHAAVAAAEQEVTGVGGTVVYGWDQVGVVVARSSDPAFAQQLRAFPGIDSVGASRTKAILATTGDPGGVTATAATDPATLQANQWDMREINAVQAHKVNEGSPSVVVGVLDSGIDATHPNLAPNIDAADSVGCTNGGVPDTSFAAWQPTTSGHGTHVAGTIAAADNNTGIVGVAPGVRVASVKVVDDSGWIYAEYAVCGFVWAADHGFKVTNNSYFVDPWQFNCPDDPDQAAIVTAVSRATAYAQSRGVLNVAAAGNYNTDLADKTTDTRSPDDTTPVTRPITTACVDIPTELPGVVTVAAVGSDERRSYYSNYGLGKIEVAAPGGDRLYQIPDTPDQNGRVLSTLPGGGWGYLQGTSMASPHVAGVAALLASTHPAATPADLHRLLDDEAMPLACPGAQPDPGGATCVGAAGADSFYGHGLVDALAAVTVG